jgi:hypothetical protein
MKMAVSRRGLFVMLGLMVTGCRDSRAPVDQKPKVDPGSATVTLIVDGMI